MKLRVPHYQGPHPAADLLAALPRLCAMHPMNPGRHPADSRRISAAIVAIFAERLLFSHITDTAEVLRKDNVRGGFGRGEPVSLLATS